MPLDGVGSSSKVAAVTEAFAEIGRVNGTMIPGRARGAKVRLAYDYWIASVLAQLAEVRRDKAKKAAVAGEVLPDHAADPYPIGTAQVVYADKVVTIGLKVVAQADRFDVAALLVDLELAGVKPSLLKRLVKKHKRSFDGAHVYTASLVTG